MAYRIFFRMAYHTFPLLFFFCFLFSPLWNVLTIQAQNAPAANGHPVYARIGSKLFVQGGSHLEKNSKFYSLDLSTSWSVDKAPWTLQNFGVFPSDPGYTGVADNHTLYVFNGAGYISYHVNYSNPNGKWNILKTVEPLDCNLYSPVLDPRTGLIYSASATDVGNSVCVYNSTTRVWKYSYDILNGTLDDDNYDGAVYNSASKSILFGYRRYEDEALLYLTEYVIDLNAWIQVPVTGQSPTKRGFNCMVINEDATKVVVFGGRTPKPDDPLHLYVYSPEIFVLDLKTKVWKKGPNAPEPRAYPACALVGDQFIAWGGEHTTTELATIAVFDVTKFAWVKNFTAPSKPPSTTASSMDPSTASQMPSSTPTSLYPEQESESSVTNVGAIAGGIVGALALVAIAVIALIYRRRKEQEEKTENYDHFDGKVIEQGNASSMSQSPPAYEGCDKIELPFTGHTHPHASQTMASMSTHTLHDQHSLRQNPQ
ncbi:hypothetical protein BX616_007314 [Lobosporangium transversale]|uniref:Galactose oxidase n=1 Tax=Lobosporangium transversale TaxID=64571 RepID=A0A1Y2H539_9FUNG|nr:hypothetical protein BCR41DRAFT_344543 [Lobosporangium transversale]KAF9914913.1 hypothetical protein BX616_007314 [Lobosporangium transversale]ORZ29101.1 hypothetical protein BCR41DRAFT_344543 [Lobosporangium transversale]|eukprot:XP_021886774.1 hypothetical protein BCR41DRAFT_344543 [Lobosporangium transversale]